MPLKLILFDFDGTLANTADIGLEILNEMSLKYHFKSIDKDELKTIKNKSMKEFAKYLGVPFYKAPSLLLKGQKLLYERIQKVPPIGNVVDVLNQLKNQGYLLGILSTNSKDNVRAFLEQYDIEFFDIIKTSASLWDKSRHLAKVIKKIKVKTEEVLYVGDEIRDISAARKTGVSVASVTWGYNSEEVLRKHDPDYLVDTPDELLAVIGTA